MLTLTGTHGKIKTNKLANFPSFIEYTHTFRERRLIRGVFPFLIFETLMQIKKQRFNSALLSVLHSFRRY